MNYRKIIILPVLFILSNILYIGCCKCVDSANIFYSIDTVRVDMKGSNNSVIDSTVVTNVDSVFLNYNFNTQCITSHENPMSFLVNASYACDCNECGRGGLRNEIDSIAITSDSLYNGRAADSLLNNLFKAEMYDNNYITVDSLRKEINANRTFDARLLITTKPGNALGHIFKLKLYFRDGRILIISSQKIYWA